MHNSGQHLSKEMLDLIKSIGDSRSKQEEDKIILKEIEVLKGKIKESGIKPKKMKEYLIRAIYIEMLGHEAHFAQFHSVNLTQDKNLSNKRVGYLSCNLLLSENSEFLIMLVSTLQKDLQSKEWIEVCTALISVIKFANSTIMQACTDIVIKLLDHNNEQVRKKSVICLYKFYQTNPSYIPDINDKMKKMLCDRDPAVMNATLNYYADVIRKNPENYKDLVSSFVVILKQIIEHRLPREFDYHRMPAPWIQVKLLEILGHLGRDDQAASENMYEMLTQVLRRADDTGINVGYAIVYQCLRTICVIYPNLQLLESASSTISRFLSSESPNLRCTGINGLSLIIQINSSYVMNHQQVIVDCLEENDETLKKNTFELLYKMTTMENVEVIIDKMMNYLKNATIENHSRKDILLKITELAERFAPDKAWFIKIMNQLFVLFGELITDEILSKLLKLINEWESESDEQEFKTYTIDNYTEIINNITTLPDSLVKLIAWVFGEYGKRIFANDEAKIMELLEVIEYLLSKTYDDERVRCWLITALTKLHSSIGFKPIESIESIIKRFSRDKNVEIQQRCLEYSRILTSETQIERNQFTTIQDECDIDTSFSFLNNFVDTKIKQGFKKYDRKRFEKGLVTEKKSELNLTPYQNPERIDMKISKDFNQYYDNKDYSVKTKNTELKVNVPKVWGKDGIKEPEKKVPDLFSGMTSITSNNVSSSSSNVTSSSKNPYATIKSEKVSDADKNKIDNSAYFGAAKKKEKEVHEDPNKEKKDLVKNSLFKGLGTKESTVTPSTTSTMSNQQKNTQNVSTSNKPTGNLFGDLTSKSTNNSATAKNEFKPVTTTNFVDLLGVGSGSGATNLNKSNNQTSQQTKVNQPQQSKTVNYSDLDDIFNLSSSATTTNQTTNQNQNVSTQSQNKVNIGTDLFGSSNTVKKGLSKQDFSPLNIDTDTFGENWMECPNDEECVTKRSLTINTPEKYFNFIAQNANFKPIQIINNEIISAANLKNSMVLLHTTIENGELSILIKCFNNSDLNSVKTFITSIF